MQKEVKQNGLSEHIVYYMYALYTYHNQLSFGNQYQKEIINIEMTFFSFILQIDF